MSGREVIIRGESLIATKPHCFEENYSEYFPIKLLTRPCSNLDNCCKTPDWFWVLCSLVISLVFFWPRKHPDPQGSKNHVFGLFVMEYLSTLTPVYCVITAFPVWISWVVFIKSLTYHCLPDQSTDCQSLSLSGPLPFKPFKSSLGVLRSGLCPYNYSQSL